MGAYLSKIGTDPGHHWRKPDRQFLREPTVQTRERAKEFRRQLSLYARTYKATKVPNSNEPADPQKIHQLCCSQQRMFNALWLYALTDSKIFWERGFEPRRYQLRRAIKACLEWEVRRYLRKGKTYKAKLVQYYMKGPGFQHFREIWDRVPRDFNINTPMPGGHWTEESYESFRDRMRAIIDDGSGREESRKPVEAVGVNDDLPPPYTEVDERRFFQ